VLHAHTRSRETFSGQLGSLPRLRLANDAASEPSPGDLEDVGLLGVPVTLSRSDVGGDRRGAEGAASGGGPPGLHDNTALGGEEPAAARALPARCCATRGKPVTTVRWPGEGVARGMATPRSGAVVPRRPQPIADAAQPDIERVIAAVVRVALPVF